jgi:hypothetical protein
LKICKKCIDGLNECEPVKELKKIIEEFTKATPVVVALRRLQKVEIRQADYMRKVAKLIKNDAINTKLNEFTLQKLIDLNVMEYEDDIGAISL